jgi:OHCU decarboxylase
MQSATWSRQEQDGIHAEDAAVLVELARRNDEYETRFGRVFLVCATGKSATEMLELLRRRLGNDVETELREAVEQQRQITQLRLRKWLGA